MKASADFIDAALTRHHLGLVVHFPDWSCISDFCNRSVIRRDVAKQADIAKHEFWIRGIKGWYVFTNMNNPLIRGFRPCDDDYTEEVEKWTQPINIYINSLIQVASHRYARWTVVMVQSTSWPQCMCNTLLRTPSLQLGDSYLAPKVIIPPLNEHVQCQWKFSVRASAAWYWCYANSFV